MNEFSEKYEWKIWIEKIIQTYDVADTCHLRVARKYGIPRKIYNLLMKRMQLARIKIKIGNSKFDKHVLVKAPSFVMKGVG